MANFRLKKKYSNMAIRAPVMECALMELKKTVKSPNRKKETRYMVADKFLLINKRKSKNKE
jgi:hypothetical protein